MAVAQPYVSAAFLDQFINEWIGTVMPEEFIGTDEGETIIGSTYDTLIHAGDGDDTIFGVESPVNVVYAKGGSSAYSERVWREVRPVCGRARDASRTDSRWRGSSAMFRKLLLASCLLACPPAEAFAQTADWPVRHSWAVRSWGDIHGGDAIVGYRHTPVADFDIGFRSMVGYNAAGADRLSYEMQVQSAPPDLTVLTRGGKTGSSLREYSTFVDLPDFVTIRSRDLFLAKDGDPATLCRLPCGPNSMATETATYIPLSGSTSWPVPVWRFPPLSAGHRGITIVEVIAYNGNGDRDYSYSLSHDCRATEPIVTVNQGFDGKNSQADLIFRVTILECTPEPTSSRTAPPLSLSGASSAWADSQRAAVN